MKWNSFLFGFQMFADSYHLDDPEKVDRLLACMRDKALDYLRKRPLHIRTSYAQLIHDFQRRYGQKDPPATSRKQLAYIKQEESEETADYAERVHQLVIDGYPGVDAATIQLLAIDAFLRGCYNKFAAILASNAGPKTLYQAARRVNKCEHSQRSIGKPLLGVRQVNFSVEGVPTK